MASAADRVRVVVDVITATSPSMIIINQALSAAKISSCLEPARVFRSDGKRPDGITLVPWECVKLLVWDATCTTIAPSTWQGPQCIRCSGCHGRNKEEGEVCNDGPPLPLLPTYYIAVETTGVFGPETLSFFSALSSRIFKTSGEKKSFSFLLQQLAIAVAIQRGNSACVMRTLGNNSSPEDFLCSQLL